MVKKIFKGLLKGTLFALSMCVIADVVANEAIKNHYKLDHTNEINDFGDVMEEKYVGGIS